MPRHHSSRLPPSAAANQITRRLASLRRRGVEVLDLTVTDPTAVGLGPSRRLLRGLAADSLTAYTPSPRGLAAARQAVARDRSHAGLPRAIEPDDVLLTASTSDAYSYLFKMLCDPGDEVLVPAPGYPLFDHLAALEGVQARPYPLRLEETWRLYVDDLEAACTPRTRAVVIISPHNPTGWVAGRAEVRALRRMAASRGLALISDEVFADFGGEPPAAPLAAARRGPACFSLGGLSKGAGLPQMKVAWILLGGCRGARDSARQSLELIADTYLSVGQPQQVALPGWLSAAPRYRRRLRARLTRNKKALGRLQRLWPACQVLAAVGGWMAILRLPATRSDEEDAVALLEQHQVLVHPGYFFDMPPGCFLVVSLLPPPALFAAGLERLAVYLRRRP